MSECQGEDCTGMCGADECLDPFSREVNKLETELDVAKRYAAKWKALAKRKKLANDDGIKHAGAAWRRILALELILANAREHHAYDCQQCGDCDVRDVILKKPAEMPRFVKQPDCLSVEYYDCRDSEVLTHVEPDEAIEDLVDNAWDPKLTELENVEKHCPITVNAYRRVKLGGSWVEVMVEHMLEALDEHVGENFGDPDGEHDAWDREELAVIADRIRDAMRAAEATATVWRCEVVSSEIYEAEAAFEMLKDRGYFS